MYQSTLTKKGQTTIPGEIRSKLGIQPGDRLNYTIEGNRVILELQPTLMSLGGSLKSDKGKGMTFAQIRAAAAANYARKHGIERVKSR